MDGAKEGVVDGMINNLVDLVDIVVEASILQTQSEKMTTKNS